MLISRRIVILILFALLLRLISLDQSLWLDEATTAKVVNSESFVTIISSFSPFDFHPPLYYLFMKFWKLLFGTSEIALRFPSVLFSILAGYVIYRIGRLLKNEASGLLATALFLFNPLIVYYSQEARMYMMAVFFVSVSFLFFLQYLKQRHLSFFFLHLAFFGLSLLTFYGSLFYFVTTLFYLLLKKRYKELAFSFAFIGAILLVISPLLSQQLINAKRSLAISPAWSQVLGKASLKNLLLIPLKFSSGRISFEPKILYYLFSGISALVVFYYVTKGSLKNRLLSIFFLIPLVLGVIVSFISPLLQYFRFLYLIIFMCLLLSLGIKSRIGKILVLTVFIVSSLAYLLYSPFHREDWKGLVFALPEEKQIFIIDSSSDPLKYYGRSWLRGRIFDLRNLSKQARDKEIVVIPYTADIHGVNYKETLTNLKYKLTKVVSFRGVTYEVWSLPFPDFRQVDVYIR